MRDKDLNKGIGGLLDPGYASKEDLKKEELDRFYREHIENKKPPIPFKRILSVSNYIPTPTLDVPEKTIVKPKKKDVEKTIATFGDPKSDGKWSEFVEKKGYTREFKSEDPTSFPSHEDQQKNMLVDVIADAKQTDKGKYIPWYNRVAQTKADNLNALKKFGHEESQIKSPPPKKVTAQDIKKEEEDPRTEGRMEQLQKIDDKGKSWFSKHLKKSQSDKELTNERKNNQITNQGENK